ncbi:MAG: hypothetical protein U9R79_19220 [Armatimonadota bacterium]|nr:hypothetical protein [Armatimonadota bacterium]
MSGALMHHHTWFRGIGGLFLLLLGVRTFLTRPPQAPAPGASRGLLGGFATTFVLSLTNLATILVFAAVFGGLGPAPGEATVIEPGLLTAGMVIGSAPGGSL